MMMKLGKTDLAIDDLRRPCVRIPITRTRKRTSSVLARSKNRATRNNQPANRNPLRRRSFAGSERVCNATKQSAKAKLPELKGRHSMSNAARLSTGVPGLDELLGGGLLPGTLTVASARRALAKRNLACNLPQAGHGQEGARGIIFDMCSRGDSQNHADYAAADVRLAVIGDRPLASSRPRAIFRHAREPWRLFASLRLSRPPRYSRRHGIRSLARLAGRAVGSFRRQSHFSTEIFCAVSGVR